MFFPRNKESKKAISMPTDFDNELSGLFIAEFKGNLAPKQSLDIKSFLYPNEIICSLNLSTQGQLKAHIFEVSMDYKSLDSVDFNKQDPCQIQLAKQAKEVQKFINFAVDYLAFCLDIFLKETKTPSSEWTKINFQKQVLFIRHHTSNLILEKQADQLLGEDFFKELGKG